MINRALGMKQRETTGSNRKQRVRAIDSAWNATLAR